MTDIKDHHRNSDIGVYPSRSPIYHTPSPGYDRCYSTSSVYSPVCHTASPAYGTVSPGQNTNSPSHHISPRYGNGHHGNTTTNFSSGNHGNTTPSYSSNQQTPPGYTTNHHGNHTAPPTLPYSHGCLTTMSSQTNGCNGFQTPTGVLYHSNTGYHGNNYIQQHSNHTNNTERPDSTQQQTGYKSIYPTLPTPEDDLCHNVKTAKIYWGVQCTRYVVTKPTQFAWLSFPALWR